MSEWRQAVEAVNARPSDASVTGEQDTSSPHDPRVHSTDCGFQLDQYLWECTCGVKDRLPSPPSSTEEER